VNIPNSCTGWRPQKDEQPKLRYNELWCFRKIAKIVSFLLRNEARGSSILTRQSPKVNRIAQRIGINIEANANLYVVGKSPTLGCRSNFCSFAPT
jgi:hypothetical protein